MSPAGLEGDRRGSRASRWSSSAATTWATSSAATRSTSACTSCRAPRRSPTRGTATSSRFDPVHARSSPTSRRARPTTPVPLTPKEDEIRRSGGIFAVGPPRVPRRRSERRRRSTGPTQSVARGMTTTEQIVWAHRVDKDADGRRRARRCASTRICCRRPTAPRRSRFTRSTRSPAATRSIRGRRRSPTITSSSPAAKTTTSRRASAAQFARAARPREAVLRDARRRHLPLLLSGTGPGAAGAVHPGRRLAQPRLRRVRRGRHRRRIDDARLRLVDRLHLLHAGAGSAASCSRGRLQPWVGGKDIVLELLRRWGAKQSQGMSVEFVDRGPAAADRVSQHDREHDGRGRGAERHLRAGRDHRARGTARKGIDRPAVSARRAGRGRASTRSTRSSTLGDVDADDRQAVQPRQRVPGRGGRARAHHVRQGDDRLVHQRQLRRPAAGGARDRARRARRD